jgi:hypothetical protein
MFWNKHKGYFISYLRQSSISLQYYMGEGYKKSVNVSTIMNYFRVLHLIYPSGYLVYEKMYHIVKLAMLLISHSTNAPSKLHGCMAVQQMKCSCTHWIFAMQLEFLYYAYYKKL